MKVGRCTEIDELDEADHAFWAVTRCEWMHGPFLRSVKRMTAQSGGDHFAGGAACALLPPPVRSVLTTSCIPDPPGDLKRSRNHNRPDIDFSVISCE